MYQIVSLIELAAYCEQEIRYDCTLAPLTAEDVNYAFWEDRQGETNIYYTGQFNLKIHYKYELSGSNYGYHVCDCHYEAEGCIEEETMHNTCNCDAKLPIPSTDTGELALAHQTHMYVFFRNNYEHDGSSGHEVVLWRPQLRAPVCSLPTWSSEMLWRQRCRDCDILCSSQEEGRHDLWLLQHQA